MAQIWKFSSILTISSKMGHSKSVNTLTLADLNSVLAWKAGDDGNLKKHETVDNRYNSFIHFPFTLNYSLNMK